MMRVEIMEVNQVLKKVGNMENDNILLFVISLLTIGSIIISIKFNKWFAVINGIVFITYSVYLYYGLFFDLGNGTALAWWFYLIVFTILQLLIVLIYLTIKWIK